MGHSRTTTVIVITIILSLFYAATGPGKATASVPGSDSAELYRCCNEITSHILMPEKQGVGAELKSKTRARMYSAASVTVSIALARLNARGFRPSEQSGTSLLLLASGLIAGPSAGSMYADDWDLAKKSMLIRSCSATALVAGHYMRRNENLESLASGLMLSGAAFLAGHALYDIFFLSAHSVEYYNARLKIQPGLSYHELLPEEWEQTIFSSSRNSMLLIPSLNINLFF